MLKAIILTSEERNEIKLAYASDDIYQYVSVIAENISSRSKSFYLRQEELFYEVMDVVDSIREGEGTPEAANFALSAYKKLFAKYRDRLEDSQADVLEDLHLNTAAVIYTASSLLTLSSAPNTVQYIPALIGSIEGDPANVSYLMKLSQTTMTRNMSNEAVKAWTVYYLSDKYISDDIKDLLRRIREFDYLNVDAIAYLPSGWSYDEFMKNFRDALMGEAKVLIPFLKRYQGLDVFDFHHDGLKTVFQKLRNRFPEMREYGYPNFEKYAKKEKFSTT